MNQQDSRNHRAPAKSLWNKKDLLFIAAILLAAGLAFPFFRPQPSESLSRAEISVDGKTVMELDLSEDQVLTVDGAGGGYNRIQVRDGAVSVLEASCPDKVCVHTGTVRYPGETIVCLPNRMIITVIQGGG